MSTTPSVETVTPGLFYVDLNVSNAKNVFAIYVGVLFFLSYTLSLFVSFVHSRKESVVYSLTRPDSDVYYTEYIILIRTSQLPGSSFDYRGRIQIKLNGSFADSVKLNLKKGKGMEYFLERGTTNIFVYHSPSLLGEIEEVEIDLVNDAPNEIPYVQWRPAYLSVMHSETKKKWGCMVNQKMTCYNFFTEVVDCTPDARDEHSIFKALCSFHVGISIFNCPQRFGMYSNFVNVIVLYLDICALMFMTLLVELAIHQPEDDDIPIFSLNSLNWVFFAAFAVLALEMIVEAFFRKTVARISACRYSMFQGLMKPVTPLLGLRDFQIYYDWLKVSLLVPQKKVIVPVGSRHPSALSVFPVEPLLSYYNVWGMLDQHVVQCGNLYLRSLNVSAFPLPTSMKWLAKEAKSRKEDMIVKQYLANLTAPMCYFCCWLIEWPLHFLDHPSQVGLIMSHIICSDILSLSKHKNWDYKARMAQICVHQWHGMISCVFINIILQSMEYKNMNLSGIRTFVYKTINQFGKRSARQIQATWRERQLHLKELELKKSTKELMEEVDEDELDVSEDENESAAWMRVLKYTSCKKNIDSGNIDLETEQGNIFSDIDFRNFMEDILVFDNTSPSMNNEMWKGDSRQVDKVTPRLFMEKEVEEKKQHRKRWRSQVLPLGETVDGEKVNEGEGGVEMAGDGCPFDVDCIDSCSTAAVCGSDIADHDLNVNANSQEGESNEGSDNSSTSDLSDKPSVVTSQKSDIRKKKALLVKEVMKQKQQAIKTSDKQKINLPVASFEEVSLGPPFDTTFAMEKDPENESQYLRYADEILGYCCTHSRCVANSQIHQMVGSSSLEILKRTIQDLLMFALDSNNLVPGKLWTRKKMTNNMFELLRQRAEFYETKHFRKLDKIRGAGMYCNKLLTSILACLELLLDISTNISQEGRNMHELERRKLYPKISHPENRCLFCAKPLAAGLKSNIAGCKLKTLVRFFSRATIAVAEKEINVEFAFKYSVQRFCAMVQTQAMREVLSELEDPPTTMTCKVSRAMICKLFDDLLPKNLSFKEMTADELRRVGTRRERIQARNDPTMGGKVSIEEEKRKQMIKNLQEQLNSKWMISVKENELDYCSQLMAKVLVHERVMGYSIYSGMLSREHEELFSSGTSRLSEIERKAKKAILKIAKQLLKSRIKNVMLSSKVVDVLFSSLETEATFIMETISVRQVTAEPTFLATCCFYIDNIVTEKIEEFKRFSGYMSKYTPPKKLPERLHAKMFKGKYKIDQKKITPVVTSHHSLISSPLLRWGNYAIKGIFPVPEELKPQNVLSAQFQNVIPVIAQNYAGNDTIEQSVAKLLKTRLKMKSLLDLQREKASRELRIHLAHVQSHLGEQIGLLSQSITSSYSSASDYQRDFSADDLFNVELYATGNLKQPLPYNLGLLLLILLLIATLAMTSFTTLRAGGLTLDVVQSWFLRLSLSFLTYFLILEPLKCLLYVLFQFYSY